jgi:hypothetical protein
MKTAGRGTPNRWTIEPGNRAQDAVGQNRPDSIKGAAKVEKFQPRETCFFLTFPFIELIGARVEEAAVEEEEEDEGAEGGGGIEKRIPWRSGAGRDENLVNLIQSGITGGNQPGNDRPGPVPGAALSVGSAKAVIEKEAEDEVFAEVRAFADDVMNEIESTRRDRRKQPVEKGFDDAAGVSGGKGIGRKKRNDRGPEKSGPPSAEPVAHARFRRGRRVRLVEAGVGLRGAPGFGRSHEEIGSPLIVKEE